MLIARQADGSWHNLSISEKASFVTCRANVAMLYPHDRLLYAKNVSDTPASSCWPR